MSDKDLDEIASAIWQMGYAAGRNVANAEEYHRGYQAALEDMADWSPSFVSEEVARGLGPTLQDEPAELNPEEQEWERAPTRARVLEWLRNRPDGASHTELLASGISRDHAALWRLHKHGYAYQDPSTQRYYAVSSRHA